MIIKTLKIASITASKNKMRYVLNNVRIESDGNRNKFVSTDGKTISIIHSYELTDEKWNGVKYIDRDTIKSIKNGEEILCSKSFSTVDNFPNYKLALKTFYLKADYKTKIDVNRMYDALSQAKKLGIDTLNVEFNGMRKPIKIWGKEKFKKFTFVNFQLPKIDY